jgi:hypothetical protein
MTSLRGRGRAVGIGRPSIPKAGNFARAGHAGSAKNIFTAMSGLAPAARLHPSAVLSRARRTILSCADGASP